MKGYYFKLAGKVFCLKHCQKILINENFKPFQVFGGNADCTVEFLEREELAAIKAQMLFSTINYNVEKTEKNFFRRYKNYRDADKTYAISRISENGKNVTVEYLPECRYAFSESQNSFSHIAIEELLMHQKRMILHSSFINTEFGAILFSGPSGVGKSTQASLWAEVENAEIINGDRTILGKENGVWRAWGSPYAGSSGYHVPKDFPVAAIIFLTQEPENVLERLTEPKAFRQMLSEVTVNSWNPWYMSRVTDMILDMIKMVPVYHMGCTPDIRAVEILKNKLAKEGMGWICEK